MIGVRKKKVKIYLLKNSRGKKSNPVKSLKLNLAFTRPYSDKCKFTMRCLLYIYIILLQCTYSWSRL